MAVRRGSTNEADLIDRFRRGDEEAFRELLERYGNVLARRIRRTLPRGLRRRVTVEDLLQESCLAAYRGRERFDREDAEAFRNWLLGIVDNKVKEAVRFHAGTARRALGREVTRPRREPTGAVRGRGPTPSAVAIGSETATRVREALATLPADYREVLRLTREEQLTLREAGQRMGRSREAMKKLYARALTRLQAILAEGKEEPRA